MAAVRVGRGCKVEKDWDLDMLLVVKRGIGVLLVVKRGIDVLLEDTEDVVSNGNRLVEVDVVSGGKEVRAAGVTVNGGSGGGGGVDCKRSLVFRSSSSSSSPPFCCNLFFRLASSSSSSRSSPFFCR